MFENPQRVRVVPGAPGDLSADAASEMRGEIAPGGWILLVYPAEPIRGLYAMPGAWIGFGNPLRARQLHVHKFTPRKIRHLAVGSGLMHVESAFSFFITPQFVAVLQKLPRVG